VVRAEARRCELNPHPFALSLSKGPFFLRLASNSLKEGVGFDRLSPNG